MEKTNPITHAGFLPLDEPEECSFKNLVSGDLRQDIIEFKKDSAQKPRIGIARNLVCVAKTYALAHFILFGNSVKR